MLYLQVILPIPENIVDHSSVSGSVQDHPVLLIEQAVNREFAVVTKGPRQAL